MAKLPPYVSNLGHGEICYPQPLKLRGVTAYSFALAADPAAMQALVDSQLNAVCSPHLNYRVASPHTLLTFLKADSATSLVETIGILGDKEAAFWIPLLEHGPLGHTVPRLVFWVPYLLIDVDSGLVVGREIWGYRKSMGQMSLPDLGAPARFSASTTIFPTFSATTRGEVAELLRVERDGPFALGGPAWTDAKTAAGDIADMFKTRHGGFGGIIDGIEVSIDVVAMALSRIVTVVNLKQFRDVADSTKACYQAITEAPCSLDKVHGAGLLPDDYRLTVKTCASHRIVEDLGLGPLGSGGSTTVPASLAFWINFDFTTLNGKELYRSTP